MQPFFKPSRRTSIKVTLLLFILAIAILFLKNTSLLPLVQSSERIEQQISQSVAEKPNIIVILSDDQMISDMEFMPHTNELIVEEGTSFSHAYTPFSACCPSRASILRGQYSHNTKVRYNKPPVGGYPVYLAEGHEDSNVATWLQDAGYYTGLIGKYMNGYPRYPDMGPSENYVPDSHVPKGWSEWHAFLYVNSYRRFQMNHNGNIKSYNDNGSIQEIFQTDIERDLAVEFIERASESEAPFYLHLTPSPPHSPFTAANRHKNLFKDAQAPRTPSFNEADVSDKPVFIQERPLFTSEEIEHIDFMYRERLKLLQSLDEMVLEVVRTLEKTGELDNTYIIFTSDNGFRLGQHRFQKGKGMPYDEDIRVPFVVRGPDVLKGITRDEFILNIDIAATAADWAGAKAPDYVDGKSIQPLLEVGESETVPWRDSILIQFWRRIGGGAKYMYVGVRTKLYKYIEWHYMPGFGTLATEEDNRFEVYDMVNDPYELDNSYFTTDPELLADLRARLSQLQTCSGVSCK